jgi:mono/diheme cytochrome c family protein
VAPFSVFDVGSFQNQLLVDRESKDVGGHVRVIVWVLGIPLTLFSANGVAASGEDTYKQHCLHCHGANGDGNGHANMKIKPADLRSDAVQKLSDEDLYKSIAFGVRHKDYAHAFANRGVSSKEISEVVTYIRKFAHTAKKEN